MRKTKLTKGAVKYAIVAASSFMLASGVVVSSGTLMSAYADEIVVKEDEGAKADDLLEGTEVVQEDFSLMAVDAGDILAELRGEEWYLSDVELNTGDGFYYVYDENGDAIKVVDSYIETEIEIEGKGWKRGYFYIDETGKMVTGAAKWLDGKGGLTATDENANAGWRYINKKGFVSVNDIVILGDNVCYNFNEKGEYTIIINEFFVIEGDDKEILYFAEMNGKVAVDKKGTGERLFFIDNPEGMPEGRYCYVEDKKESGQGELSQKRWFGGDEESGWLYVNSDGRLMQNCNKILGGQCYYFAHDFYGTYVEPNTFFTEENDLGEEILRYCVSENYTPVGDYSGAEPVYFYFKDNDKGKRFCYRDDTNEPVTNLWIGEDGKEGWLYTNSKGRLLVDTNAIIGRECYHFDEDYKGWYIEDLGEFFVLEEGDTPEETTWGYCMLNGKAAGMVDEDTGKFVPFYFKKNDAGKYLCYRNDNDELAANVWIDGNKESGWMYVNGKGRLLRNVNKILDGFCCHFDENSKGSYIEENTFFVTLEEDPNDPEESIEVWRYCTSNNYHPAGDDTGAYRFIESGDTYLCYTNDNTLLSGIWMEGMWINDDGLLVKNSECEYVEGKYYSFENFEKTLLKKTLITDNGNTYYVNADGDVVKDQFVQYDGESLYFDADGIQVKESWINDTYYVDNNGYKVTDQLEYAIGDKLYYFDEDGNATLLAGYVKLEEDHYYYENNQKVINEFREVAGGLVYLGADGIQVYESWIDDTYYVGDDGFKVVNQKYVVLNKITYNFDENGVAEKAAGYVTLDGKNYFYVEGMKLIRAFQEIEAGQKAYFGSDGAQCYEEWIGNQYVGADGIMIVNKTYILIDDKEYNFDANGNSSVVAGYITKADGNYYYEQGVKKTNDFATLEDGKAYFGADGKQIYNELISAGAYTYYVDDSGFVVTNKDHYVIAGKAYNINASGYVVIVEGHITLEGNYYYYEDGTAVQNAFKDITGGKAYFGADGKQMFSTWIREADGDRYVNADGFMIYNEEKVIIDEKPYYVDESGIAVLLEGFVTIKNEKFYFINGEKVTKEIISLDGGMVLFDEDGKQLASKWILIKVKDSDKKYWYYADENGYLINTGHYYSKNDDAYFYFYEDGKMASDVFIDIAGGKAYFSKDGFQRFSAWINGGDDGYVDANGFKVMNATNYAIENKSGTEMVYYDFDADGNWSYVEGFRTIDGTSCYLKAGIIQKNIFVDTESGTLFFGADGKQLVMEWITQDGNVWYFAGKDGLLVKDTLYYLERENKYYHFNKDGIMSSDAFVEYNGQLIYLGSNGPQKFSQWLGNDKDGWRYVADDGYVIRNVNNVKIGDVYYDFDEDGYASATVYAISYELDGGTNNIKNPSKYTGLSETITLQKPTKAGYTFMGWYADAAFTTAVTVIEEKSNGNVVLYAKWQLIVVEDDDDDDYEYVAPTPEPAPQTPVIPTPTTPEDTGEVTTDEQKGQVNSLTGIVVGATNGAADDGLSHWQGTTTEDGTTSWKMQYADGTYAAGTYVTDANGEQQEQVAWEMVSGSWYAFGADGVAKDGWVKDVQSDKWYLIDINSGMQTGWQTDETTGKTYFLDETSGAMKTGWHADATTGAWYYLDAESGAMQTGWVQTDGKWYYLNPGNGVMYANQRTPDGYFVNENGEWIPGV